MQNTNSRHLPTQPPETTVTKQEEENTKQEAELNTGWVLPAHRFKFKLLMHSDTGLKFRLLKHSDTGLKFRLLKHSDTGLKFRLLKHSDTGLKFRRLKHSDTGLKLSLIHI